MHFIDDNNITYMYEMTTGFILLQTLFQINFIMIKNIIIVTTILTFYGKNLTENMDINLSIHLCMDNYDNSTLINKKDFIHKHKHIQTSCQLNTIKQSISLKDEILSNNKTEIDSLKTNNNPLTQPITIYIQIEIKYNNCQELISKLCEENMTISLTNSSINNMNGNPIYKINELQSKLNKCKSEFNFNCEREKNSNIANETNSAINHQNILTSENNEQLQIINTTESKNKLNSKSRLDEEAAFPIQ